MREFAYVGAPQADPKMSHPLPCSVCYFLLYRGGRVSVIANARARSAESLVLDELPEEAVGYGHELLVAAALGYPAALQGRDLVRVANRAQTVGDRQDGAAFGRTLQGFLHELLRFRVQGARRFVQDQDLWVLWKEIERGC